MRQERKSKLADRQNHLSGAFSLEPETKKKKETKKCKKHLENIEFEITNDVGITLVDEGFFFRKKSLYQTWSEVVKLGLIEYE